MAISEIGRIGQVAIGQKVLSWPNPNTTTALQPQPLAPALKRDVQVVSPILSTAVQAAAAALAPTPSSIKVDLPMTSASSTTAKEAGSLLPTTLLPKGVVQLPVKGGLGMPAYLAMGAAVAGLSWWWLFRRGGFSSVRVSSR